MKKLLILIAFSFMSLTGCGILEEANNSLTYVDEMTDYLNEADQFANDLPALIEKAATDSSNIPELKTRLLDMKDEINEVNELNPPKLAKDIHQKVEVYNQQGMEGINRALAEINKGEIQLSELQNLEIVNTFEQLQDIKGNLENLGQ
ncbi:MULTISPECIES: DUF6376 family protein [Bacillaceae]|uniref:DUF6376 family protein n=1 Tax=Bacillaceae TaxID=186817 RepID=UPI001C55F22A|nr:DUF6376 family protein [Rossellomorea sp. YZS02]MBW3114562.1 hypothetical protein [Bacillus sp. MCCB 382]MDX8345601.1 DUF6376 family protein [Rossellomorea sp. YZS02]